MRQRFIAALLVVVTLVASCADNGVTPKPWPSNSHTQSITLSQRLLDWNAILESLANYWMAGHLDKCKENCAISSFRLSVSSVSVAGQSDLAICAPPLPPFDFAKSYLVYCPTMRLLRPPDNAPDGAVLILYNPFVQDVKQLYFRTNNEQVVYDVLVVLFGLFYADHLIGEADRLGLLRADEIEEHHRYCLASSLLAQGMKAGHVTSRLAIHRSLVEAIPFIRAHRRAGAPMADSLSWLLRLNPGAPLEKSQMCA